MPSEGKGPGLGPKLVLMVAGAMLLIGAWVVASSLWSGSGSDPIHAVGQLVEFRFVEDPIAASPVPGASTTTDGDVLVVGVLGWDPRPSIGEGTYIAPLDQREAGDLIRVSDVAGHTLSPGGHYVVGDLGERGGQEIARLSHGAVVAEFRAHSWMFVDDHRLTLFGSQDDFVHGGATEIDLAARTTREIRTRGLTMSVQPLFVLGEEVGLCEEREREGHHEPTCVSTRLLDVGSGDTQALSSEPEPAVSDGGQYLFSGVEVSGRVGDRVIYWDGADEDGLDNPSDAAPLRSGELTAPSQADGVGSTEVERPQHLWSTSDGEWVLFDSLAPERGLEIGVCDAATLRCTKLPMAMPSWAPLGVGPASVLESG